MKKVVSEQKQIVYKMCEAIFAKKGFDVKIIDLRTVTSMADYFIICSADSDIQIKAIADEIEDEMISIGEKYWHKEGYNSQQWILMDYSDIIVHIFKPEGRSFYNIEKIWGDAPIEDASDKLLPKKAPVKKATVKKVIKTTKTELSAEKPKKTTVKKVTAKPTVKKATVTKKKKDEN